MSLNSRAFNLLHELYTRVLRRQRVKQYELSTGLAARQRCWAPMESLEKRLLLNGTSSDPALVERLEGWVDSFREIGGEASEVYTYVTGIQDALRNYSIEENTPGGLPIIGDGLKDAAGVLDRVKEAVALLPEKVEELRQAGMEFTVDLVKEALVYVLRDKPIDWWGRSLLLPMATVNADRRSWPARERLDWEEPPGTYVPTESDIRHEFIDTDATDELPVDGIQFMFTVGGQADYTGDTVQFGLGLPCFGLSGDAGVDLEVFWELDLALGWANPPSGVFLDGFYVDTQFTTELGDPTNEVRLNLKAELPESFEFEGELGFLNASVQQTPGERSYLDLDIFVDIVDLPLEFWQEDWWPLEWGEWQFREDKTRNRLTWPEIEITADLYFIPLVRPWTRGQAEIHLDLGADFGTDVLPSFGTQFGLDWAFDGLGVTLAGAVGPTVSLTNTTFDLGSFLTGVMSPILDDVATVIEPLSPFTEALNLPLPLVDKITGDATLLDLIGNAPGLGFVTAFSDILGLQSTLESLSAGEVTIGDLTIGPSEADLRLLNEIDQSIISAGLHPYDLEAEVLEIIAAYDDFNAGSGGAPNVGSEDGWMSFALLEESLHTYRLLFGDEDVELFSYGTPLFNSTPLVSEPFPFIPNFGTNLDGGITTNAQLVMGYDMQGLRQMTEQGYDPGLLGEGFYVVDNPGPEASIIGSIAAHGGLDFDPFGLWSSMFNHIPGASFNIDVNAGIQGGVYASVEAHYAQIDDGDGDDTKLRVGPLLDSGADAIILTGDLGADLEAWARVNGHLEYPSIRWEERKLFGIIPYWVPVATTETKDVRLFNWSMNMGDIKVADFSGAPGAPYIPRQLQTDQSDTSRAPWEVSSTDLIQWAMPSAMTSGLGAVYLMTDGLAGETHGTAGEWYVGTGEWFVEYELNTLASPTGYDIDEVILYAGTEDARANQKCMLSLRPVGGTEFVSVGTFENAPFTEHDPPGHYATKLTIEGWDGPLMTGVEAVRLDFLDAVPFWPGGSVWREFDVFGEPTGGAPLREVPQVQRETSGSSRAPWTPSATDLIQWSMPTAVPAGVAAEMYLMTDGSCGATHGSTGEIWAPYSTWYAEYELNTAASPSGYDITEATVYAGTEDARANQAWTFSVRPLGGSEFIPIGTFAHVPFDQHTPAGNRATKLTVSNESGLLATGIEAVRFDFLDAVPWWGTGSVWREFDVFGEPTGGETLPEIIVQKENSSGSRAPWTVSSTDLIQSSIPTAAPAGIAAQMYLMTDGSGGQTHGSGGEIWAPYSTWYAEYELNTLVSPSGYDITGATVYAGTEDARANQVWTLSVRPLGESEFISIGTFTNRPWTQYTSPGNRATMIAVSSDGGPLATGIEAVRFDFLDAVPWWGTGSVWREFDVFGEPTGGETLPEIVVQKATSSSSRAPWTVSSTDLIQSTLPTEAPAGIAAQMYLMTDGSGGQTHGPGGEIWAPYSTWYAEYELNTLVSPSGYDITGAAVYAGTEDARANQVWTFSVRPLGESEFVPIGTYTNAPWTQYTSPGNRATMIAIWSDGGPLATGIEAVRFDFLDAVPWWGTGSVWREFDVFGEPTGGETLPEIVVQKATSSSSRAPWPVSSTDLIQSSLPTAAPAGIAAQMYLMTDGSGGQTNGSAGEIWAPYSTWYAEYELNTLVSPSGYDITGATVYAGTEDARANQVWTFSVRPLGGSEFVPIGTYTNAPWTQYTPPGNRATMIAVSSDGGPLATGIEAVRFDFLDAVPWWGTGSVWREFDVFGEPTGGEVIHPIVVEKGAADHNRALWPVSSTDLINGTTPSASNHAMGQTILTDGSGGAATSDSGALYLGASTWWAEYTLDTGASPSGYDITKVAVYAGTCDARANQAWTLLVKPVGSSGFVEVGTYSNAPWNQYASCKHRATKIIVYRSEGALAERIEKVRINFLNACPFWGGGSVWREIDVFGEPSNALPVADAGGPYAIDEGQDLSLDASGSSDADGDPLTFAWDVNGDGDFTDAFGATPTLAWLDLMRLGIGDDGDFQATVRVDDGVAGTDDASATVTIHNAAPTITLSGPGSQGEAPAGATALLNASVGVDEGAVYTLTLGLVSDPGDDAVAAGGIVVHWGDGTSDTYDAPGAVTHIYPDGPDAPTIVVDLIDEDGTHAAAGTLGVTVNNVAPTIALRGAYSVVAGSPYTLTLQDVTDPGEDTVAPDGYTVHWGDGSSSTYDAPGAYTHTYAHAPDAPVITVDLVDEDGTYAAAGKFGDAFAVDQTGQIIVNNSLAFDYETTPTVDVTVQVTDGSGVIGTAAITVDVYDLVADHFVIKEHSPNGTYVGRIEVLGTESEIAAGNVGNAFVTTGDRLYVNNWSAVDYETTPVFDLTVAHYEWVDVWTEDAWGGQWDRVRQHVGDTAITVNVNDVIDDPLILDQAFDVIENASDGAVVGTIATDPAAPLPLDFAITAGNDGNAFTVDATGQITVNSSAALDFEATPVFSLTVEAGDAGARTGTATVTVALTDAYEGSYTIDEHSPEGTYVGWIPRLADDSAITAGNVGDAFVVTDGGLYVKDWTALDYETTPVFDLTVTHYDEVWVRVVVEDADGVERTETYLTWPEAGQTMVTVHLNDVATEPLIVEQRFNVDENSADGTVVGSVLASPNATQPLSFAITAGNTADAFAIDATGQITVNDSSVLDYETSSVFHLTVEAQDAAAWTGSATMTVEINDVFEGSYTIDEHSPNGTYVGWVPMLGSECSIAAGNTNDAFDLSLTDGELFVNDWTALDYETTSVFDLTVAHYQEGWVDVWVDDPGGGGWWEQRWERQHVGDSTVVVNLTDVSDDPLVMDQPFGTDEGTANGTVVGTIVTGPDAVTPLSFAIVAGNLNLAVVLPNQHAPVFTSSATPEVAENTTVVQTISATDDDVPAQTVTFSITGNGPDDAKFQITGGDQLEFISAPDYESPTDTDGDNVYEVEIEADDGNGLTTTQTVSVTVTNVDPSTPTDIDVADNMVAEGAAIGTTVGLTASATDPLGPAVTYSLTDDAGGRFEIDATTGVVTVADGSLLDGDATHAITVQASDGSGGTSTADFDITVNNVAPSVAVDNATVTVDEGETASNTGTYSDPGNNVVALGASVGTVTDNNDGTWSWSHDSTGGPTSQTVTITATDSSGATGEVTFTLEITYLPKVVGRYIFYNNSYFDRDATHPSGNPEANEADDNAIAADKTALEPDAKATFANYTSYIRGINGIMIDFANLVAVPTTSDFTFRVGNDDDPTGWTDAADPIDIAIRPGDGVNGSDRVTILWADNAIEKQWLQVRVLSDTNGGALGLANDDIFYWGNAIGESGNSKANAWVNSFDDVGARSNPHTPGNRALVDDAYDYNRDSLVSSSDQVIPRFHSTTPSTALQLITAPPAPLIAGQILSSASKQQAVPSTSPSFEASDVAWAAFAHSLVTSLKAQPTAWTVDARVGRAIRRTVRTADRTTRLLNRLTRAEQDGNSRRTTRLRTILNKTRRRLVNRLKTLEDITTEDTELDGGFLEAITPTSGLE